LALYRQNYLQAESIKTTCTSMFETRRPVLSQGGWRSRCTEDQWAPDSRVEAYCPELPWLLDYCCGSVPRATVPTSECESRLGNCHVQPHLPQDVSLYSTWEMILRCRCKRSIRFVHETRKRHVVLRTWIPLCGWVPIESSGDRHARFRNFATVSTAKAAVVCNNVYLWSERSGDLPEF
jgi:hypothetical protein